MKLEDQCISLELAKRLKELGVNQDGVFSWAKHEENFDLTSTDMTELMAKRPKYARRYESSDVYSAFTLAELFEMLPEMKEPFRLHFGIENPNIDFGGKYYSVVDIIDYPEDTYFYDDNFANCLAKMLIYLIENKLIETN